MLKTTKQSLTDSIVLPKRREFLKSCSQAFSVALITVFISQKEEQDQKTIEKSRNFSFSKNVSKSKLDSAISQLEGALLTTDGLSAFSIVLPTNKPRINEIFTINKKHSIHLIGSTHSSAFMNNYTNILSDAIEKADIVLFEQDRNLDSIIKIAREFNKPLYLIDRSRLRLSSYLITSAVAGMFGINRGLKQLTKMNTANRCGGYLAKTAGYFHLLFGFGTLPQVIDSLSGKHKKLDISPYTEGRSVAFLSQALDYFSKNESKKNVLLICGNEHAVQIARHLKKGSNSNEFLMKRAFFGNIFSSMLKTKL